MAKRHILFGVLFSLIVACGIGLDPVSLPNPTADEIPDPTPNSVGDFDSSFGIVVTATFDTSLAGVMMEGYLTLQTDGKIIQATAGSEVVDRFIKIARLDTVGVLDPSFGTAGIATHSSTVLDLLIGPTIIDANGSILTHSTGFAFIATGMDAWRTTLAGNVDTSFSTDAKASGGNFGGGLSNPTSKGIALSSDGKIYHLGSVVGRIALMRYLPTGAFDTSFATDGSAVHSLADSEKEPTFVVAADDQKAYVSSWLVGATNTRDFGLMRFTVDGVIDTTFGTQGVQRIDILGSSRDSGQQLAKISGGKILMAGFSTAGSEVYFAAAQFLSTGALDTAFHTDGITSTLLPGTDASMGKILVQSDGKIILLGGSHNGTDWDFALLRYFSDGQLDSAFGVNGIRISDFGSSEKITDGVFLPDRILIGGVILDGEGVPVFNFAKYRL